MHDSTRLANLLGATALGVNDLILTGITAASHLSASAAAALVTLQASPGLSVTELGRRVGLTQSAAARMVDSLEEDHLVERHQTVGRWVNVHPTDRGRRAASHILDARADPLGDLVARLGEDDRRALATALPRLLEAIYAEVGNSQRVCRLCDRSACLTDDRVCPVGEAERDVAARLDVD